MEAGEPLQVVAWTKNVCVMGESMLLHVSVPKGMGSTQCAREDEGSPKWLLPEYRVAPSIIGSEKEWTGLVRP